MGMLVNDAPGTVGQPRSTAIEPLLSIRNLAVHIGQTAAVSEISLDIFRGEFLGVVGESGSGKSVTARAVLGLLPAHARVTGSITLDGEELLGASDQRLRRVRGGKIGLVFQDALAALDPVYTVGDQLVEALLAHHELPKKEARARAADLLAEVRIPQPVQHLSRYPHELSGGMRQRVVIASALIADPALILADEPTTALDVTVQRQVLDLIAEISASRGTAVMLITHDLSVVAETCDRVTVFYGGLLVEEAEAVTLFDSPRHPYTSALLRSLPRLGTQGPFEAIPGSPAQIRGELSSCPFAPRCSFVTEDCTTHVPREHSDAHGRHRCLRPLQSGST
jgi:oligopeptide/dipeptide ABC transporter ATP-binding protein